jgi:hypothetical protein
MVVRLAAVKQGRTMGVPRLANRLGAAPVGLCRCRSKPDRGVVKNGVASILLCRDQYTAQIRVFMSVADAVMSQWVDRPP